MADAPAEMTPSSLGLAFGLVLAAGLSTTIGAASVFVFKHTNLKMLAASLGVSAGVMLYVSFVEIFASKSVSGFQAAGYTDNEASRYSTLCFFGGMFVIWLLDKLVHLILKFASQGMKALDIIRRKKKERVDVGGRATTSASAADPSSLPSAATLAKYDKPEASGDSAVAVARALDVESQSTSAPRASAGAAHTVIQPHCGCHSVADVLSGGYVAQGTPQAVALTADRLQPLPPSGASGGDPGSDRDVPVHEGGVCDTQPDRAVEGDEVVAAALQTDNALSRMGLLAALAIGIHNLPEGLATFVGTLADPTAGIVIAIAIALHNIPEGIVVAMPIYYASGSKWKGFWWGTLSGITEPIGALLGYAVLRGQDLDPMVYALMFGLVGGMMVYISLTELLPTALKYDPDDTITTWAVVIGMAVMAASLLLFAI